MVNQKSLCILRMEMVSPMTGILIYVLLICISNRQSCLSDHTRNSGIEYNKRNLPGPSSVCVTISTALSFSVKASSPDVSTPLTLLLIPSSSSLPARLPRSTANAYISSRSC